MKATMKNHEHLNKIRRNLRKITRQFIMASLILAFASCEKEELLEPVQEIHEVDESVKGTAQIGPRLSLRISQRTHDAAYGDLRIGQGRTVRFDGSILATTLIRPVGTDIDRHYSSQIWASSNGSDWTFRRNWSVGLFKICLEHQTKNKISRTG